MMFEPNGMEVYFEGPFKDRLKSNSSLAFLGVTTAVINEDKNDTKPSKKKRYTKSVTLFLLCHFERREKSIMLILKM